jgi:hypothetical protein
MAEAETPLLQPPTGHIDELSSANVHLRAMAAKTPWRRSAIPAERAVRIKKVRFERERN